MKNHRRTELLVGITIATTAGACLTGCQTKQNQVTKLPDKIVKWEDPQSGAQSTVIRDANNDSEDRFVAIGTNGDVQFEPISKVCEECEVEDSTILVDGAKIDIRWGIGATGDENRHPFLVDQVTGTYIQLVGDDDGISFQTTDALFDDYNNDDESLAIRAGQTSNPSSPQTREAPLCGTFNPAMLPILLGVLMAMRFSRQRQ